eukprot:5537562-Amphidinium_carterae.1
MHCAKLYTLVSKESLNIFAGFSRENFKQSRKDIIEAILHTDMGKHQGLVKDLQLMYQMNAEHFGIVGGTGSQVMKLDLNVASGERIQFNGSMSLRSDSGEKDGAAVFNQASSKPVVMDPTKLRTPHTLRPIAKIGKSKN